MKKLKMTFRPDGTVTLDAVGFTGAECVAATKDIETAIGTVIQRTFKPEYHETSSELQQLDLGA